MQYYLRWINGVRGAGVTPDGTFPTGAVECTQAQYENSDAWTISDNAVVAYTAPAPTSAQLFAALQGQAKAALTESDKTILRCCENAVAVPEPWAAYRAALRAIVNGSNASATALPIMPAYPAGT